MPAVADIHRMAGIMPALISRDAIEALGQDIDDLALSFVAPLNSYDREILCH